MFKITRIFASDISAGGNILRQASFPIADHDSTPSDPDVTSDHGVIFAENGTCKTTLLSFLLNTFCPDQKRFVQHLQSGGDKTLSQYLVPGRPAVILIEMAVPGEKNLFEDNTEMRLVIGQMLYRYKEASKPLVRYYFQAQAPDFFHRMQESWLQLLESPKPLSAVREFLNDRDNQVVVTDVQKDWEDRLEKIGLDPWLVDRQIDFARSEGGIKDAFRFRCEADFLSFFLGCVTDMNYVKQLRAATLTNMEKMRTMPWKKKRLAAVLSLKARLEDFHPIAALYIGAKEKQKSCTRELEQAAFLVSRALPKAETRQQQTDKRLKQAQQDENKVKTDLESTRADLLAARAFALDLAQKERLKYADNLRLAIKAGETLHHALDAADILARINLITGRLKDKEEVLAASGSALTPLREKADRHARAFHACITQRREQTQKQINAAKAQAATAKEKQETCRRELKETQGEHTKLNNNTNQLQARLEMALEAGNAIDPHFLEAPGEYSDRLEQDLNRTKKDLSQTREKRNVLNDTLSRENQNREALSIQQVRDQGAIDDALARKTQERTWQQALVSDPHIRTAAGSDSFDPTNAAHVSALSDAVSRKTQELGLMEQEGRTLANEIKRLDEVRTLAVDDQTRRLIRHYRDTGINPTQIRELVLNRNAMEKSLNQLKAFRETYPDPAAVKRLDLDLDLAKAALEKTSREISAAQDRITDIQARITRCDNRIGELTSDQARFEEALKHARQWLAQYGEWQSWQQQVAQNRQTLKTLNLKIKTLEFQDGDLAQAAMDATSKIPALEKDRDRLDELAREIPLPLDTDEKDPDTEDQIQDMAPQDIKSLYSQAQANLQQRSTELGVAALEREVQDLGRDLADLQGQMTRFQSTHAFDFDQAREWAAKESMERQEKRDVLAAQKEKDTREQLRAENKAEMLEKEDREVHEELDLFRKKQIKPRLTPGKLQGFSLEEVENTLIPELKTAKLDLENRQENMAQQISHARENLELINTWFNTLKTLAARAGEPKPWKGKGMRNTGRSAPISGILTLRELFPPWQPPLKNTMPTAWQYPAAI